MACDVLPVAMFSYVPELDACFLVGSLVVGKPIRRVAAEIDNNIRVPNSSKLGIKSATNVLVKRRYGQAILPISGTEARAQYFAGFLFNWAAG